MKMKSNQIKSTFLIVFFVQFSLFLGAQEQSLKVLNFYGDNGFVHSTQGVGVKMIEDLGESKNWNVVTTNDASVLSLKKLLSFDVVIFNNNCGNKGAIMSSAQHMALQQYIRNGGGFVAIHCAGAIWKEGGEFQQWYEGLIGTRLIDHPKVQEAKLIIEDSTHVCTAHLPKEWSVTDEWHRFSINPRENVHVLISLDEDSYEGEKKMGGDHPFTWCQHYDGGRSFFTSLGHTQEIFANPDYQKMVEQGILWAAGCTDNKEGLPVSNGLMLDLDADYGIQIEERDRINSWSNKVTDNEAKIFVKQDEGRKVPGSGRPRLALNVPKLNGHNTVVFHQQELVCHNEDVFDKLSTGTGYTWFSVMAVYEQQVGVKDVNSFFGNLRNTHLDKKGKYEGFWGGLYDDNTLWMGSRNGMPSQGRWNDQNPLVLAPFALDKGKYYVVMGRMDAGTDSVNTELFVNNASPIAVRRFSVNTNANPSKMCIGQERDAINHPGKESFDGEMARFLIYDRPFTEKELSEMIDYLVDRYGIDSVVGF